jgi:hypothetical protein
LEVRRSHKAEGGNWKGQRSCQYLRGAPQIIEKEEEISDIEKKEGSGSSKSQTSIERDGAVIERI